MSNWAHNPRGEAVLARECTKEDGPFHCHCGAKHEMYLRKPSGKEGKRVFEACFVHSRPSSSCDSGKCPLSFTARIATLILACAHHLADSRRDWQFVMTLLFTKRPLRYTTLLFAVVVHYARADPVYHAAFLALTCCSIVRHWCERVPLAAVALDRAVAYVCYALCAHTHLVEHPSACGAACLVTVLGLWIHECRTSGDWRRPHVLLHLVGVSGALLAVWARSSGLERD